MRTHFHKMLPAGERIFALNLRNSSPGNKLLIVNAYTRSSMAAPPLLITDINVQSTNWTVKVMVVEKQLPRVKPTTGKSYQRLVLSDSEENKVQTTLFGEDIEVLEHTLKIYHTYNISNAKVSILEDKHRIAGDQYQWAIFARTPIQECNESPLSVRSLKYNFVSIAQLEDHFKNNQGIDMLFAIIQVGEIKYTSSSTFSHVLIVDQGLKVQKLTLWDQFPENEGAAMGRLPGQFPIAIGHRLKVTPNYGVSLATKPSSTFILNPALPQATELQTWCIANSAKITEARQKSTTYLVAAQSPPPKENNILRIEQLPTEVDKNQYYWIRATVHVTDLSQKFWYLSCPSPCFKVTDASSESVEVMCNHCKKMVKPITRVKIEAELSDSTGKIVAVIFEKQAETIFSIKAEELKNSTVDGKLSVAMLETLSVPRPYILQIRAYKYDIEGVPQIRFNVNTVLDQLALESPSVSDFPNSASNTPANKKAKRSLFQTETTSDPIAEASETSNLSMEATTTPETVTYKTKND